MHEKSYFLPRCSRAQALNSSPCLPLQASRIFSRCAWLRCAISFAFASQALGSLASAHIAVRMQSRRSPPVLPSQALRALSCAAFIFARRSSQPLGSLACEQSKRALAPGFLPASPCGACAKERVETASRLAARTDASFMTVLSWVETLPSTPRPAFTPTPRLFL